VFVAVLVETDARGLGHEEGMRKGSGGSSSSRCIVVVVIVGAEEVSVNVSMRIAFVGR
jgi:hypothetical protein